jgi:CRISPR-associated protein Cmr5
MANNISTVKGLEQGRAKFAYECAVVGSKIKKNKEYKSYVKKIPMLIKINGIGETFAFINSKKDGNENKSGYAYQLIYSQTTKWLIKDEKKLINLSENDDLIEKIISLDSPVYRAVTNEVIAFFTWLTRFADGLIEGEADNE